MRILKLLLSIVLLSTAIAKGQDKVANQILLQLKPNSSIDSLIAGFNSNYPSIGLDIEKRIGRSTDIWLLNFDAEVVSVEALINQIKKDKSIEFVQGNHTTIRHRVTVPNDQDYPGQWALNGSGGARINAPEAWDISTGGPTKLGDSVVIAVIDQGFDVGHYDVNYFTNYDEIPGNNIDDDNNGYVDDVNGWNAYNGSGLHPVDNHGTHVAGIVAAKGNNGSGIAGVSWDAKVLPISGSSDVESVVLESYVYALEMRKLYDATNGQKGAYVVATNSSFGVDFGQPADYPIWCAFYDTLGKYGIVSAGATTNGFLNVDAVGDIPTTCPSKYMIAVTNISMQELVYGGTGANSIDFAAPGTDIYSTIPANLLAYNTGTSMATPHVAGTIGLMYSAMCTNMLLDLKGDPQLMADTVVHALLKGGDSLQVLANKVIGAKRLNLKKALEAILDYNCIRIDEVIVQDSCGVCEGNIAIVEQEGASPFSYQWSNSSSNSSHPNGLCVGEHRVTITDSNGFTRLDTFQVTGIPDSLEVSTTVNLISNGGAGDGSIELAVSGGTPTYSYLWNDGVQTKDRFNLTTGVYTVTITDSKQCSKAKKESIVVTNIASHFNSIKIYPNPAQYSLKVEIEGEYKFDRVELYTIDGKKVVDIEMINSKWIDIPISSLANGVYFLKLVQYNRPILIQKVIKY